MPKSTVTVSNVIEHCASFYDHYFILAAKNYVGILNHMYISYQLNLSWFLHFLALPPLLASAIINPRARTTVLGLCDTSLQSTNN